MPLHVLLVSTGRVGSNMVEKWVPQMRATAHERSIVLPSTHHLPYSSTETSPYGLSLYDKLAPPAQGPITTDIWGTTPDASTFA